MGYLLTVHPHIDNHRHPTRPIQGLPSRARTDTKYVPGLCLQGLRFVSYFLIICHSGVKTHSTSNLAVLVDAVQNVGCNELEDEPTTILGSSRPAPR